MNKSSKIYIAGHRGLVGSAILNNLQDKGYTNFITKTHKELDLSNQKAVAHFFEIEKPEYVFLAAAKVGGIIANNTYRADFIYENLMIQSNVIHQSYLNKVKKLLFLGSTCIYPKDCLQPMKEEYLLTDTLEYTNEPYAIAKIAGIKMCESYNLQYGTNYIAVQPTNLYGPNDSFDLEKSHVLPALIRKLHLGKALEENNWDVIKGDLKKRPIKNIDHKSSEESILKVLEEFGVSHCERSNINVKSKVQVEIWGSGKPMREFLWSEDMADACVHLMEQISFNDVIKSSGASINEIRNTHINIGTGKDISIKELAELVKQIIDFKGDLFFNTSKPDGTMKKLTDVEKLKNMGWEYKKNLWAGINEYYDYYRD